MSKFNINQLREGEPNPFTMYLFLFSFILIYPIILSMAVEVKVPIEVFFLIGFIGLFLSAHKLSKEIKMKKRLKGGKRKDGTTMERIHKNT